jgi:hypothetical protein
MHADAVFDCSEVAYNTAFGKFHAFAYFCPFANYGSVEDSSVGYMGF